MQNTCRSGGIDHSLRSQLLAKSGNGLWQTVKRLLRQKNPTDIASLTIDKLKLFPHLRQLLRLILCRQRINHVRDIAVHHHL
jgi:hypothetical protein